MKNKIENLCQTFANPLARVFEANLTTFAKPLPTTHTKKPKTLAIAIAIYGKGLAWH